MIACEGWWLFHCAWLGLASFVIAVVAYWILKRATDS